MLRKLKQFRKSERGAVTVDWVVLTAAVVSLAVVIVVAIHNGAESVGDGTGTWLGNRLVGN
ncbi:hypothetical protein PVW51_17920 [Sulfitobacter sp. PR48]|jgi:Flp pilus assembly pilin Flp|uniref:Pilus assembly protein n=1 Tax=Sulfitobacter porphyrae TaxID=1246864 RepID=A0ABW2B580_9RHOB|nr:MULTISPECIES: hypothetical protein [unclassified Sulfitobacter]MCZ4258667.1 hypothetical protein [Sulfitobacter sp. G21635-S1]MDD9722585.1 hypothetical protein [Sulfitobacter sp. PR48]GLT08111.1 hypothetical protein GCM10007928_03420 [Sulfitobacter porphyrae]